MKYLCRKSDLCAIYTCTHMHVHPSTQARCTHPARRLQSRPPLPPLALSSSAYDTGVLHFLLFPAHTPKPPSLFELVPVNYAFGAEERKKRERQE